MCIYIYIYIYIRIYTPPPAQPGRDHEASDGQAGGVEAALLYVWGLGFRV